MFGKSYSNSFYDILIIFICVSYLVYCYSIIEFNIKHIPICPFYLITSVHCPLCGMSRSFGELLHGNLDRSLTYHPLSIYLFLFFVIFLIKNVISLLKDIGDFKKNKQGESTY
jgi:hypothetical protein